MPCVKLYAFVLIYNIIRQLGESSLQPQRVVGVVGNITFCETLQNLYSGHGNCRFFIVAEPICFIQCFTAKRHN